LYIFMQLLIHYLGGETSLAAYLELQRRIRHPWPLQDLKPIQTDKAFFRSVKQGVLQFVLIKPLTAILAVFLESINMYHDGSFSLSSGYFYIAIINNISVSLSLYSLILFYMATEERLLPFRPLSKFLCIKAIIFFSFWQSCFFTVIVKLGIMGNGEKDHQRSNEIQNFLICIEMFILSFAHSFAFSYSDFVTNVKNQRALLQNLGSVLSVKDVIHDARRTFITKNDDNAELPLNEIYKDSAFYWSAGESDDEIDISFDESTHGDKGQNGIKYKPTGSNVQAKPKVKESVNEKTKLV